MQKQIVYICTLLLMPLTAMEKSSKIQLQLTHQSPEITCIHTKKYLKRLTTQADTCQSPHEIYSHENCASNLNDVAHVLTATNAVIETKKDLNLKKPCYGISRVEDSSSWAGNTTNTHDHSFYAGIPIAVAHALQTNLFKRILIIDENLDQNPRVAIEMCDVYPNENAYKNACTFIQRTTQDYYNKGNGSLLYPDQKKYPDLFDLFNGKIITYDKIQKKQKLWDFLDTDGKDIDLVFYNINTYIKKHTDQRNQKIFYFFQKLIPTIFILCGRFGNDHIIDYIKTTHANFNLFFSEKSSILYDNDQLSTEDEFISSHNDDDSNDGDNASSSSHEDTENSIDSGEISSTSDDTEHTQLTHQSPEITCVHTQEYLDWLAKNYDPEKLKSDLNLVTTVLNATDDVIQAKKNADIEPLYSICVIPDNYYGAGNSEHNCADSYAIIPIAVAHALKSNLFKRILIVNLLESQLRRIPRESDGFHDEFHNEIQEYFNQGNGSLLYPNQKNNSKLFDLFEDRIITPEKTGNKVFSFLETADKDTDLIFYNIDVQDYRRIDRDCPLNFLDKLIPIIFVLFGCPGKDGYDPTSAENISKIIATNASSQPINIHYWYKTEI